MTATPTGGRPIEPTSFGVGTSATRRTGMQGQVFRPLVDAEVAPTSPLCQLVIAMTPGKVSTPHVHVETHVYVHVKECGPQGALTLYGDALEYDEWTFADQTLWIPPGIPHVAIYPYFYDAPPLVALETRATPHVDHDVVPLPTLWSTLGQRIVELDMVSQVELPPELEAIGVAEGRW